MIDEFYVKDRQLNMFGMSSWGDYQIIDGKIHDILLVDRRVKLHKIADSVGILTKQVNNIFHE